MGSVRQHIFHFDAFVQRRVDGLAFFFMRRGHGKPIVRYWAMAIFVAASALRTLLVWALHGTGPAQNLDDVLSIAVFLVLQHLMLRSDRKAEAAAGTLSSADRFLIVLSPIFKPYLMIGVPAALLLVALGEVLFGLVLLVGLLTGLAVIYLSRTPYTPPPAKEKVPIMAEPAPSSA